MIDASELTPRDMYFIGQVSQTFNMPNIAHSVIAGDVNRVINYPHTNGREALLDLNDHDWMSGYDGPLLTPVILAVEANIAKEKANPGTSLLSKLYAKMGLDPATRHQKLYLKYLGR
jgi:hypothetical protein